MKRYLIILIAIAALSQSCKKGLTYEFTTDTYRMTINGTLVNPGTGYWTYDTVPYSIISSVHHTEKSFDELEAKRYVTEHAKVTFNGIDINDHRGLDSSACTYEIH